MSTPQGKPWESNIRILGDAGYGFAPMPGLLFSDVTVKYRRTGDLTLTTKDLVEDDWTDLGLGFYVLRWTSDEMSQLGSFMFLVSSLVTSDYWEKFDIDLVPVGFVSMPPKCVVSGNIVDLGGAPASGQTINFRLAKAPAVAAASSFISGEIKTTIPDAYGNFSIALLRGATVVAEIAQSGIRQQITIPDQATARLLDLLPPILP